MESEVEASSDLYADTDCKVDKELELLADTLAADIELETDSDWDAEGETDKELLADTFAADDELETDSD